MNAGSMPEHQARRKEPFQMLRRKECVEIFSLETAALFAAMLSGRYGAELAVSGGLALVLILLALTDLRCGLLPDRLTAVLAVASVFCWGWGSLDWSEAAAGGIISGGSLFFLRLASRGGLGLGDVKMGAALGLWLGWQAVIPALALAFLLGGTIALLLCTSRMYWKDSMAFGPFLAIGGYAAFLWGRQCWQWYAAYLL